MGLPTISVEFKRLAETASVRSARGIVAVILQDATAAVTWTSKVYTSLKDVRQEDFTEANYTILGRTFDAAPYQVLVVRVGADGTMETAQAILDSLSYNWICTPVTDFQAALVTYVKSINTSRRVRKAKALVTGQADANDMHIVNVANTTVTLKGAEEAISMAEYLPRLAGLLAACPMDQSVSMAPLADLAAAAEVNNLDTAIDSGNLCIFQDDDTFRIARGVNTLKTLGPDHTQDMKKIAVVEAMDLIQEDVIRTFKTYYQGKKKNTADNQALFTVDVSAYLHQLAQEDVIDREEEISVGVDVAAMRAAWESDGTSVADLTDAQVKKKTFRSFVYLRGRARLLDAMEDMSLIFNMG